VAIALVWRLACGGNKHGGVGLRHTRIPPECFTWISFVRCEFLLLRYKCNSTSSYPKLLLSHLVSAILFTLELAARNARLTHYLIHQQPDGCFVLANPTVDQTGMEDLAKGDAILVIGAARLPTPARTASSTARPGARRSIAGRVM